MDITFESSPIASVLAVPLSSFLLSPLLTFDQVSYIRTDASLRDHLGHLTTSFYLLGPYFDYFGFEIPLNHGHLHSSNMNLCVLV